MGQNKDMSTTTSTKPSTFSTTPDCLTQHPTVEIKASEIRKGMVLVDTDGFALFHFTDRERAHAKSGSVAWWGRNVDTNKNHGVDFHRNKTVLVAA